MDDDDDRDPDRTGLSLGDVASQVQHLIAVGQLERAAEIARSLVADNPDGVTPLLVLSQVLRAKGELDAAQAFVDQAAERSPDDDGVHFHRALTLFRRGKFADTERAILKSIELAPSDADYHRFYARLLNVCGKEKRALAVLFTSLELDGDSPDSHQMLAALLLSIRPRDLSLPRQAAERALALDPEDAEAHAIYGLVMLQAREMKAAEERFRTALTLDPSNELALRGLAEITMASAPFYRPFLSYSLFMIRAGTGMQLLVVAGVWVLVSALVGFLSGNPANKPWSELVQALNLAFCAYTWFARPMTKWALARRYPWLENVTS